MLSLSQPLETFRQYLLPRTVISQKSRWVPLENQTSQNKKSPLSFLIRCCDITYYYPKRLAMKIRAIYSRNPSNTERINITNLKQNIVINCFVALQ